MGEGCCCSQLASRPTNKKSLGGNPGSARGRRKASPGLSGLSASPAPGQTCWMLGLWGQCHSLEFHVTAHGHKAGFPGIVGFPSAACSTRKSQLSPGEHTEQGPPALHCRQLPLPKRLWSILMTDREAGIWSAHAPSRHSGEAHGRSSNPTFSIHR